jgi:predicted enzyme related to lactoylglutathione lyase
VRVRRLAWLGVPTTEYHATVAFFQQVLGLKIELRTETSTELSTELDDRVQVFAPDDPYYDRFGGRPVALFEVEDVRSALRELEQTGVELLGDLESDGRWTWINVRGPDGNVYELASRLT